MKKALAVVSILVILMAVMSTQIADIMPDSLKGDPHPIESETKAMEVFKKAWVSHGVDSLLAHESYQMTLTDHWKGMMGNMGKLWPQEKTQMTIKYAPNTFDAQLEFLDGETKGQKVGLQSWNYYEQEVGGEIQFKEYHAAHGFGMAAFQYFTELVGRLSAAELIRYVGTKEFNGGNYDVVFATWGSLDANEKHDQYLIYFNQETSMIDYVTFTIRDSHIKMPGSGLSYGSLGFYDYRDVDGFQVPFDQCAFMFEPKEDKEDYLHRMTLTDFQFDSFDVAELYPNPDLEVLVDSK